jgi:ATP-binding cassette subfamily C (CFTR/MRP) protein 1
VVTEEKIQKLINRSFANSTVFTIAHRINTIINSDKVLVLDQGRCVEYDSPKVLTKDDNSKLSGLIKEIKSESH